MTKLFTSITECRRSPQGECTFHKKTAINRIILLLIGIELYFIFIFTLEGPFVSVFIKEGISKATMSVVGIASMIFLITKSTLQIPLSRLVDRSRSENSIAKIFAGGYAITALCPLVLAFSSYAWQVYLAQFFCGLGSAFTYPSWNALFTHHIDEEQAAFEWSIYDTVIGFGGALATALGGFLIDLFGFQKIFLGVGIIILLSSFLPFVLYKRFGNNHTHAQY
jgi:MFS family permease